MSPSQQARMAEIREIGQKMKDVNDIFTTGQKMNDKVLVAGARQKLAQLAKQKHDLETQPVAEGKKDLAREEGTYTLVFSSDQKPYSWGKFFAKSKEDAKKKAKDIFKKHNFTNVNVRELAIKESIEEGFDGIKATPVSGPGAHAGESDLEEVKHFRTAYGWAGGRNEKTGKMYKHPDQIKQDREEKAASNRAKKTNNKSDKIAETFADQGSGSGATGAEDGNEVTRRFGVTVVDPNATSVSQRKEKIQKVIRIRGGEEVDAENRAVDYYKRRGYKVIDAWFIDEVDALGEATAEWPRIPKDDSRPDHYGKAAKAPKVPTPDHSTHYGKAATWPGVEKKSVKEGTDSDWKPIVTTISGEVRKRGFANEEEAEDWRSKQPNAGDLKVSLVKVPKSATKERTAADRFRDMQNQDFDQMNQENPREYTPPNKHKYMEDETDKQPKWCVVIDTANSGQNCSGSFDTKEEARDHEDHLREKGIKGTSVRYTKPWTGTKSAMKEDASAGASCSSAVAVAVTGTPGIIRRVGKGKKKGLYGNSVNPQTFTSALGKGIYEAEEKKKGEEKFDYEKWKKSGDKAKKPRGKHSEKTLLGKGKNGWNKEEK